MVRAFHTAVCLGYGDHPQLLLYGGMDGDHKVLSDVWILDVESRRWREVRVKHQYLGDALWSPAWLRLYLP